MTLKEYIKNLQDFAKKNPDALGMKVVSATDPEGNFYHPVVYKPTMGSYEKGDFSPIEDNEDWLQEYGPSNAVSIN